MDFSLFLHKPWLVILGLVGLVLTTLSLYFLIRAMFQTLKLVAVLGLTGMVGGAVWLGLSLIESSLGPDWHFLFFYRFIPSLDRDISLTKAGLTLFVSLAYLWYLLKDKSSS